MNFTDNLLLDINMLSLEDLPLLSHWQIHECRNRSWIAAYCYYYMFLSDNYILYSLISFLSCAITLIWPLFYHFIEGTQKIWSLMMPSILQFWLWKKGIWFLYCYAFMTSYFVNIIADRTLGLQIRRADLVQQYWDRDNSTWPWVQVWHLKTLTDSLCLCWRSNFHTLSSLWLFLHFCICFVFWSYTLVLA